MAENRSSPRESAKMTGKASRVAMISEEKQHPSHETLYLTSIPGMRESIQAGMKAKTTDCQTSLQAFH